MVLGLDLRLEIPAAIRATVFAEGELEIESAAATIKLDPGLARAAGMFFTWGHAPHN